MTYVQGTQLQCLSPLSDMFASICRYVSLLEGYTCLVFATFPLTGCTCNILHYLMPNYCL